jgi:elongation factor P--(R)-beta-lysine ligase
VDVLYIRAEILDAIRAFFKHRAYLEVETPVLTKYPGMEPQIDLFETEFVSKSGREREKRFLNHSPELYMKRLLGRGYERVFQVGKVFRNGEGSEVDGISSLPSVARDDKGGSGFYRLHHPEFTMLEWYQSGKDYEFMMQETEDLALYLVNTICDLDIEMCSLISQPWKRMSVREAFFAFAHIDLDMCRTLDTFLQILSNSKLQIPDSKEWTWNDWFFWVMLNKVEPNLPKDSPVILYDYPSSQAALARKKQADPFYAERFEVYIDGVELCNAFGELCDPIEQRRRLEAEQEERRAMGKVVPEIDEEFLAALEHVELATGNALGVDRLVMLLLGERDVREVLLF